ncbi:hypothetical protein [Terrilactibacillus laevilacticus]|uniref:Uncharacterized protein n=1 Tax=Terrilactibacillus laevilacticus TaxID=1380157 RepID=A0ABW5PP73_9BACI
MIFSKIALTAGFILSVILHWHEPLVDSEHSYRSVRQLINTSDVIVLGTIRNVKHQVRTNRQVGRGRLVNYEQIVNIKHVFKGNTSSNLSLITTGVNPLPPPRDPINKRYTGPLAEGDYLLFLSSLKQNSFFRLNSGFQSVYPFINQKMIALEEGFHSLNGLTTDEVTSYLSQ